MASAEARHGFMLLRGLAIDLHSHAVEMPATGLHNLTNCKAQARHVPYGMAHSLGGGQVGRLMQLQFLAAIIEINFQAEQTSNNLGVIA